MTDKEVEGIVEKVADVLRLPIPEDRIYYSKEFGQYGIEYRHAQNIARQILQTEHNGLRVGVYREEGELPINEGYRSTISPTASCYRDGYKKAQQDMLSAGYRQFVEVKE